MFAWVVFPRASWGTECRPATGYSPCIDANALWPSPGDATFFALASPRATAPGRVALGVQGQVLVRPLVLNVPGPVEDGRDVRVVDYAVDETLLLETGLGFGWSMGLGVGTTLVQEGAGAAGITSQRGAPLARTAIRDPRVSVAYSTLAGSHVAIEPRLELAIPLGDEDAYAGAGSVTAVPGLAVELRAGAWRFGVDVSARLRRSVELGTGRWGSQACVALGAAVDLVSEHRLFLAAEAFALPPLTETTSARGRALGAETTWIPAEWLLSLGARPDAEAPWTLVLGAGSGLPLSSERRDDGPRTTFFGPTTPAFRGLIAVRYAPVADD